MNIPPELMAPKSGAWSCFLTAHIPLVTHHLLYTDSQESWWEGTSADFWSSLPPEAGKAEGMEVGHWGDCRKHTIPWVNKAGCY